MFGASRTRAGAAASPSGNAWHALAKPVGNLAVTFRRSLPRTPAVRREARGREPPPTVVAASPDSVDGGLPVAVVSLSTGTSSEVVMKRVGIVVLLVALATGGFFLRQRKGKQEA
jgi:hypothetical protein